MKKKIIPAVAGHGHGRAAKTETKKCVICGKQYTGYGNNVSPLAFDGRCCDKCNLDVIVPIRMFLDSKMYDNNK